MAGSSLYLEGGGARSLSGEMSSWKPPEIKIKS